MPLKSDITKASRGIEDKNLEVKMSLIIMMKISHFSHFLYFRSFYVKKTKQKTHSNKTQHLKDSCIDALLAVVKCEFNSFA